MYTVNPIKRMPKLWSSECLVLKLIFCARYCVCEQFGANTAGIEQDARVDDREVVSDECVTKHGKDLKVRIFLTYDSLREKGTTD